MLKKHLLAGVMVTVMLSLTLSGCGSSSTAKNTDTNPGSSSSKLSEVTLKIMIPGDRPANMNNVIAEAEKRMKDTVNAKLDVVFIPWSDLKQKTQIVLTSGETVDLMFDAPWNHSNEMIAAGYYTPLDDLIKQYGPNLLKVRPELMMSANKYNGSIMGLPLGAFHSKGRDYLIRQDIREKLGIAPIKSYDDLVKFLQAVKDKEPGMIPISTNKSAVDMSFTNVRLETDYNLKMKVTSALGQSMVLYHKNNDGKVYNLFDQMEPKFMEYLQQTRKMYTDKLINQDLLAGQDAEQLWKAGKAAVVVNNDVVNNYPWEDELKKAVPTAKSETFTEFKLEPKANISNFMQSNFQFIPKSSKNKERAIMFLDWANASQDNYDLLAYGIKGTDWEPVGDKQYKSIGTGYSWFPYAWIWNPTQERMSSRYNKDEITATQFMANADNFTADVLTGFTFDAKPVANEISQWSNLETKYYLPLMNGMVDPDKYWESLKKEGAAPVKKIQTELQSQIDKFLASKKK